MQEKTNIGQPVRELYAALNEQDLDAFDRVVSEQVELVDYASGETLRGREAFKRYFKNWWTAFPKGTGEIRNLIESGDQVAVEVLGRGVQSGPFEAAHGRIEPSSRMFELHFGQVFRVKEGRIASCHSYSDAFKLVGTPFEAREAA